MQEEAVYIHGWNVMALNRLQKHLIQLLQLIAFAIQIFLQTDNVFINHLGISFFFKF